MGWQAVRQPQRRRRPLQRRHLLHRPARTAWKKAATPSTREIDFSGVYRVGPDGKVTLATRDVTKPNGLAFSPDEKTLYVGQSDRSALLWRAFPVQADGSLGEPRRVLRRDAVGPRREGRLAVTASRSTTSGNLFATGPGGVLVITPHGNHLGTISPATSSPTARSATTAARSTSPRIPGCAA